MIYNVSNENGLKLVGDPRVGAVGFTGSRNAGLHLKRAAEDAGKPIYLDAVTVGGTTITLHGSLPTIARVHKDWFTPVHNPAEISHLLRSARIADLFTFRQVLPHTSKQYDFPMEWTAISALPIRSHEDWLNHSTKEVRKNVKKACRRGVTIRRVAFDDSLVHGITNIFNEARLRQGGPFWHYGKRFAEVKEEMGQDLQDAQFIGAYFEGDLIGFYKLVFGTCFAQPVMSLSMLSHRDKYTDTALISEAVTICAERRLQYLTYGDWRRDSHRDFLESHGFTK